jgi:hypothetical protein
MFLIFIIMGKAILTILLILICHICSAPTIDFRLKLLKFKALSEYVDQKQHDSEFLRFIDDLGYRESRNNWLSVNRIGCFGEWQFAESTLKYLGFRTITLKKFKANPRIFPRELQMKALRNLIKVNLAFLMDYQNFIGESIKGISITKSGMIAASHLGGAGSLKKFLNSKGLINNKDAFGTSISDYLKKFCGYDLD